MDENGENNTLPLLGAAIALHEMFVTLLQAGFTEKQALTIVGDLFKNSAS